MTKTVEEKRFEVLRRLETSKTLTAEERQIVRRALRELLPCRECECLTECDNCDWDVPLASHPCDKD